MTYDEMMSAIKNMDSLEMMDLQLYLTTAGEKKKENAIESKRLLLKDNAIYAIYRLGIRTNSSPDTIESARKMFDEIIESIKFELKYSPYNG